MSTKNFGMYFLTILCFITSATCLTVNQCEGGGVLPTNLKIGNCSKGDDWFCYIKFISQLDIEMTFSTNHYMERIQPRLTAKSLLGNFTINVDKKEKNACKGILNTFCPLIQNELVQYHISANLLLVPLVPVTMIFELIDLDLRQPVVCFQTYLYPYVDFKKTNGD